MVIYLFFTILISFLFIFIIYHYLSSFNKNVNIKTEFLIKYLEKNFTNVIYHSSNKLSDSLKTPVQTMCNFDILQFNDYISAEYNIYST